jgi:hypothetical protein
MWRRVSRKPHPDRRGQAVSAARPGMIARAGWIDLRSIGID